MENQRPLRAVFEFAENILEKNKRIQNALLSGYAIAGRKPNSEKALKVNCEIMNLSSSFELKNVP